MHTNVLFAAVVLVGGVAVGLAACGDAATDPAGPQAASSGTSGTSGGGPTSGTSGASGAPGIDARPQGPSDYPTAYCAKLAACSPYAFATTYGTAAECTKRQTSLAQKAAGAKGIKASAADLNTCATQLATTSCADFVGRKLPAACTVPGTLQTGAACALDQQCAGGRCKQTKGAACGVCANLAATDGACVTADDCGPGATCTSLHKCGPFTGLGQSCGAGCNPTLECGDGYTCYTPLAVGAACNGQCDEFRGIFCRSQNGSPSTCQAAKVNAVGQECGFPGSDIVCAGPANCLPRSSLSAHCTASPQDGASCNDATGEVCEAPAFCASGKCTLPDPGACN